MRWAAIIAIWVATAAAIVGTAALLRPDPEGITAFVALFAIPGAVICTWAIAD